MRPITSADSSTTSPPPPLSLFLSSLPLSSRGSLSLIFGGKGGQFNYWCKRIIGPIITLAHNSYDNYYNDNNVMYSLDCDVCIIFIII